MTLSHGPHLLAMPGPTATPDAVLGAMARQSIDIYAGELVGVTDRILAGLARVFRAQSDARVYLYIANGHGGWEAAISNTFSRGDKVLVLESGRFATGWGEMAAEMGVKVEVLPGKPRGAVDPAAVRRRLEADRDHEIAAVLTVQIDTASSAVNDIPEIRAAIDAAEHPALLYVDAVASLGCVPFDMAAWGVDLAMTGSQKGLMTPPGLAMLAAGPRALARRETAGLVTRYWDWWFRDGELHYMKYCGTPPEQLLFALERALRLLLEEEGLEAAWARHRLLAAATRAAVAEWARPAEALTFNILDAAERADTVTALRTGDGCSAAALRTLCAERLGVTLGTPIGEYVGPGGAFRIAHMGHASAASMLGVLGATEVGMRALGWRVGEGVAAATATLASGLATAIGEVG